jgi:outer membrane protein assembly factor BamB
MSQYRRTFTTLLSIGTLCLFAGADWLQFRGTDTNGVAAGPAPPVKFSGKDNVAWKADVPGRGVSGPIVVAGKVVVTSSSGFRRDRLHVICFDAKSGKQEWEREFWATGRTFCHPTSAVAAPTPCSDGKQIYAFYSSNDLICLDLEGNLKWLRGLTHDYPTAANDVGMSSSPVVIGDTVIVQVENYGESFVAGVSTLDGETRWKVARPRAFNWASPSVLRGKGGDDLVLLQSGKSVEAVRPRTGETIWRHETACSNIPSTTADGDTVYVPTAGLTAFRGEPGSASPKSLWSENRLGPSSSSPVAHEGRVYVLRGSVLVCGDAETGQPLWQLRVRGQQFWATPLLADKHLYLASAEGLVQVIDVSGKQGKIVGESNVADEIYATPAIAHGALYVRTGKQLWKIAK